MRPTLSRLATTLNTSPPTRRPKPLSLEHFLLRSRVLSLYRTIIRSIYTIPSATDRSEPLQHAKAEFSRNRNVTETAQIRYLVSTGKAEWDGMRRYVEELAARGRYLEELEEKGEKEGEYSEEESEERWERPRMRNVPR